jgi:iron complex outermembrane receptor protein
MVDTRAIPETHDTKVIDAFITHDLSAVAEVTEDVTFTAAFVNIFDQDPPFSATDLGYDPFTANPLGRVLRLGLRKRF